MPDELAEVAPGVGWALEPGRRKPSCRSRCPLPKPQARAMITEMVRWHRAAGITAVALSTALTSMAYARTFTGKTSQRKPIQVQIAKHQQLASLVITFAASCSDKRRRTFGMSFARPFSHPQDSTGHVGDSTNGFGGKFSGGHSSSYTFHATFSAQITRRHVTGIAKGEFTLKANGVVCNSHRVQFRVHV